MEPNLTENVTSMITGLGADISGVADVAALSGLETIPSNLFEGYTRAISIAVALPRAVFDMIEAEPMSEFMGHHDGVVAASDTPGPVVHDHDPTGDGHPRFTVKAMNAARQGAPICQYATTAYKIRHV